MEKSELNKSQEEKDLEFQKIIDEIDKAAWEKYPIAFKQNQHGKVQVVQLQDLERIIKNRNSTTHGGPSKGRGGNNVAQNMKKSVISVMKKHIPKSVFEEFQVNYIQPYQLKSQKENFILYFLFLHQLLFQNKIQSKDLRLITKQVLRRAEKYVLNSQVRIKDDIYRSDFHEKNFTQFRKYLQIDLDFCRPRSYMEVYEWIQGQYQKKRAVFKESEKKVRRIIQMHPLICKIFVDLQDKVKFQSISQNENEQSSEYNQQLQSQSELSS